LGDFHDTLWVEGGVVFDGVAGHLLDQVLWGWEGLGRGRWERCRCVGFVCGGMLGVGKDRGVLQW